MKNPKSDANCPKSDVNNPKSESSNPKSNANNPKSFSLQAQNEDIVDLKDGLLSNKVCTKILFEVSQTIRRLFISIRIDLEV